MIKHFSDLLPVYPPNPFSEDLGKVPSWIRHHHGIFDLLFYDMNLLSEQERRELTQRIPDQGEIIVVHPTKDRRYLQYFCHYLDFLEQYGGAPETIDTIVIADISSSSLGVAALARMVADALAKPVAGIVSGYGELDMMADALGGWFNFRVKDQLRVLRDMGWLSLAMGKPGDDEQSEMRWLDDEPESHILINLLIEGHQHIQRIVGHGKGSLSIQHALQALVSGYPHQHEINDDIEIITLGCGVVLPEQFHRVYQYVGTWDIRGVANTPWPAGYRNLTWIPGKGHNLVLGHPLHLPAEDLV